MNLTELWQTLHMAGCSWKAPPRDISTPLTSAIDDIARFLGALTPANQSNAMVSESTSGRPPSPPESSVRSPAGTNRTSA